MTRLILASPVIKPDGELLLILTDKVLRSAMDTSLPAKNGKSVMIVYEQKSFHELAYIRPKDSFVKSKKPAQGKQKQAKSDKRQSAKQPAETVNEECRRYLHVDHCPATNEAQG